MLKHQSISLDLRMQALERSEKGERQVNIGADLKLPTSTIHTILKNKDKNKYLETTNTVSSAKNITCSRCYTLEEMENLLSIWIANEPKHNMLLSQVIIMEKVRSIYSHIQSQTPDMTECFSACRGWFDLLKKRNNLYNLMITGEAVSSDTKAAAAFPDTLKEIVKRGNYPPGTGVQHE
ncbi:tigger transposable element-derived protein 1-like [Discoglossus pictus]